MTAPLWPLPSIFYVARRLPFRSEGKFLRAPTLSQVDYKTGRWALLQGRRGTGASWSLPNWRVGFPDFPKSSHSGEPSDG